MEIKIEAVKFNIKGDLEGFINSKVEKLDQYHDKIILCEVILQLDSKKEHDNKIAEVKLFIPGKDLFVKKQSKSFEESVDNACEALRRQLLKTKGKLASA